MNRLLDFSLNTFHSVVCCSCDWRFNGYFFLCLGIHEVFKYNLDRKPDQIPIFIIYKVMKFIEDIQMFVVNMTFISSSEVKKCIFHECRRKALMKYTFFHFTRWNKSHIHDKHLNFLFIIYITFDRKDASLAFARESLTRSFVPWRHDVHVLFCLVTLDMTSETRIDV